MMHYDVMRSYLVVCCFLEEHICALIAQDTTAEIDSVEEQYSAYDMRCDYL